MKIRLRTFIIIFCLVSFVGINSFAKNVKCFVLSAPKQMLVGVQRIAVLDFEDLGSEPLNNAGAKAADYMVEELLKKDRGIHEVSGGFLGLGSKEGKTYQKGFTTDFYSIAERSRIEQVMQEQALGMTGIVNEAQAANLGQLLGVDAVITGTVEVIATEKKYKEKREKKKKNKPKKVWYVDCAEHTAKAKLSMRIISVSTGEIIGQKNTERTNEDSKCEDSWGDIEPLDELAENSIHGCVGELVNYFAPHFVEQKIELKEIKVKKYKKKGEKAIKHIEKDEFPEAFAIYSWIEKQDPYNHRALYMKGVLYELAGNYPEAYGYYEMAYNLKDDEKDYKKALKRVEKAQLLWKNLNDIGINLDVMDLTVSERDLAKVEKKRVKLQGNSKDRIKVYTQADKKSEVIAKVPGGVKLDYIEKSGKFYKVRLIDGKEGYIYKEKVDKLE